MISYIKGTIIHKGANFIILEAAGIGYKITVHEDLGAGLGNGEETALYTHQYVRENALELYGFESYEKLELFELLLSISGIGPKSALNSVYIASVGEFKSSVSSGDPSLLAKVAGVGKKTAERAVLDLRGKIGELDTPPSASGDGAGYRRDGGGVAEEAEALIGLGYSRQQALEALKKVPEEVVDSGERIREALKMIGK